MTQYDALAAYYDRLTDQSIYDRFCSRICQLLQKAGIADGLILELCCGTGSLARLLSQRGYEMICCDASPEMLNIAREKCGALPVPPVFICQEASQLDLYGTVRAAVCCLDSVNYMTDLRELKQAFSRVSLFLEPGGLFIFDVKSLGMFRQLGGTSSVQEGDDWFCSWQYGFEKSSGFGFHQVDIFVKKGEQYLRFTELHEQRCYGVETLKKALDNAGLRLRGIYQNLTTKKAAAEEGRLLFVAEKE